MVRVKVRFRVYLLEFRNKCISEDKPYERENMYTNKSKWSHEKMYHIAKIKNKKTQYTSINITQMMVGKQWVRR